LAGHDASAFGSDEFRSAARGAAIDRGATIVSLTRSERVLLETIGKYNGQWNWYKLGRVCFSKLDSPADFTLSPLINAGFLDERSFEGEPLLRLRVTELGRAGFRL
jgi:hypothetical protein